MSVEAEIVWWELHRVHFLSEKRGHCEMLTATLYLKLLGHADLLGVFLSPSLFPPTYASPFFIGVP